MPPISRCGAVASDPPSNMSQAMPMKTSENADGHVGDEQREPGDEVADHLDDHACRIFGRERVAVR